MIGRTAIQAMAIAAIACGAAAQGQPDAAEETPLVRPDGTEEPSRLDSLAECGAIVVVAAANASNVIDGRNLQSAAFTWYGLLGQLPDAGDTAEIEAIWAEKMTAWSSRRVTASSMRANTGWSTFCAGLAAQYGADPAFFELPPEAEPEAEPEPEAPTE
ncbi:hypothetical protein HKCCE3408_08715 [Rhodobacterales bacterium HKCCE3408]|nr:hypothetical protein [Rhodobacterales bacterium HKCCE3408]